MRLKKITLKNFRCYETLELDLHPRLTVIVGQNGSGKTAILDAIAIGLSPALRYLSSANQRLSGKGFKDTDFRIESWGVRAGRERWGACDQVQINVETTAGLRWLVRRVSGKSSPEKKRKGAMTLAQAMARIVESLKSDQPELLPIFAYYGAQRGYIEIPQRLRAGKQNYDYPATALVDSLNSQSNFREMLQWFDLEETTELRANKGCRPDEYEESPALSAVREALNQVLGEDYSNPRFSKDHKFVIDAKQGPTPLQVSQLSQGYQSMLALAMDFARRLAIGNGHIDQLMHRSDGKYDRATETFFEEMRTLNPKWFEVDSNVDFPSFSASPLLAPGIMLIDEIDLHLHPAWQQRVLTDLLRAFPMTQFIVTTHSPQVLSTVRRENVRSLGLSADGQVVVSQPLAPTYGEPSGDVLHSVMLVDPQPPVVEKAELQRLTELVDQGLHNKPEALQLMDKLLAALGEQHPQLLRLQRSIQRQRALKG